MFWLTLLKLRVYLSPSHAYTHYEFVTLGNGVLQGFESVSDFNLCFLIVYKINYLPIIQSMFGIFNQYWYE